MAEIIDNKFAMNIQGMTRVGTVLRAYMDMVQLLIG